MMWAQVEEGSWQEKVEMQRGGQGCRGEGRDAKGRAGMHSENYFPK